MSSSDYYWSRHLIQGFGKMWFLIVPQEADASGGGASLLGSVVNELSGGIFPANGGIIGREFPEPNHLTTPQLLLNAIASNRQALGLADDEQIVKEVKFPNLNIVFERDDKLKAGIGNFPSLPVTFSIDYSRMENISIQFGDNTRKLFIPTGFLSRLKDFVGGDDKNLASDVSIDRETIINQILLTDQYSVTFQSSSTFDKNFESSVRLANQLNAGRAAFELERSERKKVTVSVNNGKEYLIALKDIDWDDL